MFVGLLRAVNVGGTGKLVMSDLKAMCETAGFQSVRTYIASGNVVFRGAASEREVKAALERALLAYAGKPVGVAVRSAAEMADVLAANPFPGAPANRVVAIFLDEPVEPSVLDAVTGRAADEAAALGRREIYVRYGTGMAHSKLRIPGQATARRAT